MGSWLLSVCLMAAKHPAMRMLPTTAVFVTVLMELCMCEGGVKGRGKDRTRGHYLVRYAPNGLNCRAMAAGAAKVFFKQ
ncbi:MAG: hypothetical protein Q7R22_004850 [Verrucomicrobiota bacterium JB025]|nr:hypothetical protein [Verrucomicrobiota bacterium JB025]